MNLEEIRRYNVGFYFATYYIKQLEISGNERIRDSICVNCGTLLVFRCNKSNVEYLQNYFNNRILTYQLRVIEQVDTTTDSAVLLTRKQQYLKIIEEYPLVKELKERLKLELD